MTAQIHQIVLVLVNYAAHHNSNSVLLGPWADALPNLKDSSGPTQDQKGGDAVPGNGLLL